MAAPFPSLARMTTRGPVILRTVVDDRPVSGSIWVDSWARKMRDPREVVPLPPEVRKLSRIVQVKRPDWGSNGGEVKPSRPPKDESTAVDPKSAWMNTTEEEEEVRLKKRRSQVTFSPGRQLVQSCCWE